MKSDGQLKTPKVTLCAVEDHMHKATLNTIPTVNCHTLMAENLPLNVSILLAMDGTVVS